MTQEHTEFSQLEQEQVNNQLPGPGKILRLAREKRHMGLEEVAKNLRLSVQRLTSIEADNYADMGASAFARGYLRSYARFLNIPEAGILQSFDDLNLQSDIHSNKPRLINEKIVHHVSHPVARWFGYIILLLVLIGAGFWWHNHANGQKAAAEDKSAATMSELNQQGVVPVVEPQTHAAEDKGPAVPLQIVTPDDAKSANATPAPADNNSNAADNSKPTSTSSKTRKSSGRRSDTNDN